MIAVLLRQTVVVCHDQVAVDLYARAFLGKVQRYDRNILQADILPDIQLRPVGQREHTDALPFMDTGVVDVPQLRTLVLRVPLVELVAERIDTFFRPALLFIATGASESGIELIFIERMQQRLRLHQVRMHLASVRERPYTGIECLHIGFHDQVPSEFLRIVVAELNHLLELPFGIDVHQRERNFSRRKSLFCQANHDGRVFSDRIKHHRILKLGSYLPDDMDRLCFQLL